MPFDIQTARLNENNSRKTILPSDCVDSIDPFLGLLEWGPDDDSGGFRLGPELPQGGFDLLRYVVTGALVRSDPSGRETIVRAGGLERITPTVSAEHVESSGSSHSHEAAGLHAISIWIRIPRGASSAPLRYQTFDPERLPVHSSRGSWVRVLAGSFDGARAPLDADRSTFIAHVRLGARADIAFRLEPGATTLVYALAGSAQIGPQAIVAGQLAASREPRSYVALAAQASNFEALVLSAVAIPGPVLSAIDGGAPRFATSTLR